MISVRLHLTLAKPRDCRVELSNLSLEQNESFQKQNLSLQALVASFTDTSLANHLAGIMSDESYSTREHITQSFKRQEEKQKEKKFHQSFLESLYFPNIYCRQEEN